MNELDRMWFSEEKVKTVLPQDRSTWKSRYDLKEQVVLENNIIAIRNLRANDMIPAISNRDIQHVVTQSERYRPDIIANDIYGDPRLAWIILAANNMSDIFELETDINIVIPSVASIYGVGGVLAR